MREIGFGALRVVDGAVADGAARRPHRQRAAVEDAAAAVPVLGRFVAQLSPKEITTPPKKNIQVCPSQTSDGAPNNV